MKFTFSALIILTAMLWNLPVFGNTTFMHYCQYGALWQKDEVSWLKYVLKAETCEELTEKISKLKSYNEFLVPFEKTRPLKVASWSNDFPELNGLKSKYDINDVERILGKKVDRKWFFRELDGFRDFKNLKILDFTVFNSKYSFCHFMYSHRYQVKTVVIDWSSLSAANECKFNSAYTTPQFIITGDFLGSGREKIAENIIGIESFSGTTRLLLGYPNLRYVGITIRNNDEVGSLVLNQNITHLTLNSSKEIEDISNISELQNLSYLGLTCVKNELDLYGNTTVNPIPCDKPYLSDLSFLQDLTWLKSLNLSYSGLENVDSLLKLKQLSSLDITHNRIKNFPDFSSLKNLVNLKTDNDQGVK